MTSKSTYTYGARAEVYPNLVAKRLFETAEAKKSNIVVSADLTTTKELLDLAHRKYKSLKIGQGLAKWNGWIQVWVRS